MNNGYLSMKIHSRLIRIFITLQVAWWVYLIFIVALSYLANNFMAGAILGFPIAVIFALVASIKLRPSLDKKNSQV